MINAVTLPIAAGPMAELWTAAVMALINAVMGTLTAYVLVRYQFPSKAFFNAVIDLPFAIPTLVTGVMLVVLYGPQSAVGGWLDRELGWRIISRRPEYSGAAVRDVSVRGARGAAGARSA